MGLMTVPAVWEDGTMSLVKLCGVHEPTEKPGREFATVVAVLPVYRVTEPTEDRRPYASCHRDDKAFRVYLREDGGVEVEDDAGGSLLLDCRELISALVEALEAGLGQPAGATRE